MTLIGEKIFARDAEGRLASRIGTLFLKTPGLVTERGVHAMQRLKWIEHLNAERAARGEGRLSMEEEDEELRASVDLIFTEHHVLIRPYPDQMDLAFQADEVLQTLVSKRAIRFLNTNSVKVRKAITERGENWRIARQPITQEDMASLIESSKVPICEHPIYYYNRNTGTRYVTASTLENVEALGGVVSFRRQISEFVAALGKRNRLGHLEVDLFPTTTPIEVKQTWKSLKVDALTDAELIAKTHEIDVMWRMSLPAELRDETPANYDWRNLMCETITQKLNDTTAEEQELVSGIAPEFYRQIEWLPGARIVSGEVVFDPLYAQAQITQDPKLLEICDSRVKALIFNLTRVFGDVDFINVGRIVRSLAREPIKGSRRGNVYIIQYREKGAAKPSIQIVRVQKWGVVEHLDEGKDLLASMLESDEYFDYVLDRRLMCRQLGMNLPARIGYGNFIEKYMGHNGYRGCSVRTGYFVRPYIPGYATDKVPISKYRNPAFAQRFAALMGGAAAIDMVVGRRSSETKELLFDKNYEVVQLDEAGLPARLMVTSHAGSFVNYEHELEEYVTQYAACARRRAKYVTDFPAYIEAYVKGFETELQRMQKDYHTRRAAYDHLFVDRPYDTNGSGAYRWARVLARLDTCNPAALAAKLREAIVA